MLLQIECNSVSAKSIIDAIVRMRGIMCEKDFKECVLLENICSEWLEYIEDMEKDLHNGGLEYTQYIEKHRRIEKRIKNNE